MTKYLVTGATGQLGRLVVDALEAKVAKGDIAVLVRSEEAKAEFDARGLDARIGDYTDKAALEAAFEGVERLLLISSSEVGQRSVQHANVIDAAKAAGVSYVAYTSLLRATDSAMGLAAEHKETEAALSASGLDYTLLRNGWYSENYLMAVPQVLEMGQHFGSAGAGRISSATRQDYAEAAAAVLAGTGHEGKTYELGGDSSYTLTDFAAAVAEASGKEIAYVDLPEAAFKDALVGAGLPEPFAALLADSDARVAEGWLETSSSDLSDLIGRPTTSMAQSVADAVAALNG
jgi:NAD(P)H dehydrogenase (quinone)